MVIANRNAPRQTVISGTTAGVEEAVERLRDAGLGAKRIPVACAFHTPLVAEAGNTFAKVLAGVQIAAPEVPVWSNRTAAAYGADPERIRAELSAQIGSPVGFVEEIEAMYAAGARVFVEAGPGATLTRLVDAILGDRPHRTVAVEGRRRTGLAGFLAALAQLAVAGVDVRTTWLFRGRDAVDASTAVRRKRPGWTVNGQLVRTAAGALLSRCAAPRPTRHSLCPGAHHEPRPCPERFRAAGRRVLAYQSRPDRRPTRRPPRPPRHHWLPRHPSGTCRGPCSSTSARLHRACPRR